MGLAGCCRAIDTDEYRHCPAEADDDPAAVMSFGLCQDYIGDNALSQNNDQSRSDKFAEKRRHGIDFKDFSGSGR